MRVDVFLQELGSIEEIVLRNNARKEEYQRSMNEKRNANDPKAQAFLKTSRFTEANIIQEKSKIIDENNQKNRLAARKLREDLTTKQQESSEKEENKNEKDEFGKFEYFRDF